MSPAQLKEKWRNTPHCPGVYLMKGAGGHIIYVGKAKNLKRRLANYFSPSRVTLSDHKTRALIRAIEDFDYYELRNDAEALMLEQKFIKDYRPHYNVQLRDDKRFYLLRAPVEDELPRFSLVRLKKEDKARYIGPFVHGGALKDTVEWLNHRFKLRSCTARRPGEKEYKHCHDDVIRQCSAPCIGRISPEDYRENFAAALGLLEGTRGRKEHLDALSAEMQVASDALEFEHAARLRDIRENIQKTLEPTRRFTRKSGDLPGTVRPDEDLAELGRILDMQPPTVMECFDISNLSDNHIVASMVRFTQGRPDNKAYRRYRIKGVDGQNDFASMLEVIRRRYTRILRESTALHEKPAKLDAYTWLKQLSAAGKAPIIVPDLIVVDGGKGQLGVALDVLREVGLEGIPIIGLAKRNEEIYLAGQSDPLEVPVESGAIRLLQRLRDEAHRFANNYNELLVRKRVKESALDAYPSMTQKKKEQLLKHYRSVKNIRNKSAEELAQLEGISLRWAKGFCNWVAEQ